MNFKYFYSNNNGEENKKFYYDGEEVNEKDFIKLIQEQDKYDCNGDCGDNCKCQNGENETDDMITEKDKKLNIYEIRLLLKQMPKDTEAIMYISKDEWVVALDEYDNLIYKCDYRDDNIIWKNVFKNFADDDILFATFKLKQEDDEEWVHSTLEEIIKQLELCKFADELGHSLESNTAFKKLKDMSKNEKY